MTLMVLFGTMFIAFSLPAAIFLLIIRRSAKLVIVMYCSAFFWILAAVCAAIVWNIIIPLKSAMWWSVFIAVPFQELFRWLYWKLLKRSEAGLNTLGDDGSGLISRETIALSAGTGFGSMSAVMQFNMVLDATDGPGALPSPGCSSVDFAVISSLLTFCFFVFNLFWTMLLYQNFEERSRRTSKVALGDWKMAVALLSHVAASFITLNNSNGGSCTGTMVPEFLLLLFNGVCVWCALGLQVKIKTN